MTARNVQPDCGRAAGCAVACHESCRGRRWFAAMVFLLAASTLWTGCSSEDPQLQVLRDRFLLDAEPERPTTIAEAKAAVATNARVVFAGRISGPEHEAFAPGEASFSVTEILPEGHDHGDADHADNCPFCRRKAAQVPRAAVQFVDETGETLAVDSRKLFNVTAGDTVVILGRAELSAELDLLLVTAEGIYVRSRQP